jgi:hypothetical protein
LGADAFAAPLGALVPHVFIITTKRDKYDRVGKRIGRITFPFQSAAKTVSELFEMLTNGPVRGMKLVYKKEKDEPSRVTERRTETISFDEVLAIHEPRSPFVEAN